MHQRGGGKVKVLISLNNFTCYSCQQLGLVILSLGLTLLF
jgi:hypothetical protein